MLTSPELAGRKTNSHAALLTREYLKTRFKEHQLTVSEQPFTYSSGLFSSAQGVNIIATNTVKDLPVIVITAHYDHLGQKAGKLHQNLQPKFRRNFRPKFRKLLRTAITVKF